MPNSENQERDIDAVIRMVQQQMPAVRITQWHKIWPADDDNLWWFALPGVAQDIQVEGASCPFLIETDEQCCRNALKPVTVQEAVAMIINYLMAAKEGRCLHLEGQLYWQ